MDKLKAFVEAQLEQATTGANDLTKTELQWSFYAGHERAYLLVLEEIERLMAS